MLRSSQQSVSGLIASFGLVKNKYDEVIRAEIGEELTTLLWCESVRPNSEEDLEAVMILGDCGVR